FSSSLEFGDPLDSVGNGIAIDCNGAVEPLNSFSLATGSQQAVGVRIAQTRNPGSTVTRMQRLGLQQPNRLFDLATVTARTSNNNRQLNLSRVVELRANLRGV